MIKSILVIAEQQATQQKDKLTKHSLEVIAIAQHVLKDTKDATLSVAVVGDTLDTTVTELQKYAINDLWQLQHDWLEPYSCDAYCAVYQPLIEQLQPDLVLMPHSYQIRDFAPALAVRFQRSLISDCINLKETEDGLLFTRQLFQGRANADVTSQSQSPVFASLQSGRFNSSLIANKKTANTNGEPTLHVFGKNQQAPQIRTKHEIPFCHSESTVDFSKSDTIVAIGRGIKSSENLDLIKKFTNLLGAELAASRPLCDDGWLPSERQVGSSGQSVSPKLYIAIGISGAIQHVIGMNASTTIVAINSDANAPIFDIADYGIVGDLFQVVPALIKVLEDKGQSGES